MKNIIIIALVLITNKCYSQITGAELKSGKYYENKHKNDFIGDWQCKSCEDSFKVSVKVIKRNIKRGTVDLSADFLVVSILKKFNKGDNLSNQFVKPIELISLFNDNEFSGYYQDPVTKNNIKIIVTKLPNGDLSFDTKLPEVDVNNDPKKGTIFSKNLTLSK